MNVSTLSDLAFNKLWAGIPYELSTKRSCQKSNFPDHYLLSDKMVLSFTRRKHVSCCFNIYIRGVIARRLDRFDKYNGIFRASRLHLCNVCDIFIYELSTGVNYSLFQPRSTVKKERKEKTSNFSSQRGLSFLLRQLGYETLPNSEPLFSNVSPSMCWCIGGEIHLLILILQNYPYAFNRT